MKKKKVQNNFKPIDFAAAEAEARAENPDPTEKYWCIIADIQKLAKLPPELIDNVELLKAAISIFYSRLFYCVYQEASQGWGDYCPEFRVEFLAEKMGQDEVMFVKNKRRLEKNGIWVRVEPEENDPVSS